MDESENNPYGRESEARLRADGAVLDPEPEAEEAPEPKRTRELIPLADRMIVRVVKDPEVTAGGIILTESARERSQRGIVLAVGPGRYDAGQRIELDVSVGDVVLFSKYGGTELPEGLHERDVEGGQLVLREADVLAIERWHEHCPQCGVELAPVDSIAVPHAEDCTAAKDAWERVNRVQDRLEGVAPTPDGDTELEENG